LVADLHFKLTIRAQKLPFGNDAFGFQAGVDDDDILPDVHHDAVQHAAGTHLGLGQTLFKQFCKAFAHNFKLLSKSVPAGKLWGEFGLG
jgi:hypothetical protein